MLPLPFGVASLIGAILFPIVYLIFWLFRHAQAWATRTQRPKEHIGGFMVVFVVIGLLAGSFAQPLVDTGVSCIHRGKPLVPCVLLLQ